jgi:septum site-determining protein MinD
MRKLTLQLKEQFDYILLDCPAGIERGFQNAIAGADRAIVVTTPEVSAIRDADRIIGLLHAYEVGKIDLVVNRLRKDMIRRGDMMDVNDVLDILSVELLGAVYDDEAVVVSTNHGEPLVCGQTVAGRAYMNICKRILGEEIPLLDPEKERSVWLRFTGMFQKAERREAE